MVIDQLGQVSQSTTTRTKTSEPQNSTAKSGGGSNSAAAAPTQGDTVQLSEAAKALQNVEKRLADTPDVDSARVNKIKQDIESGNYQVNPDRIAEKMMQFDSLL